MAQKNITKNPRIAELSLIFGLFAKTVKSVMLYPPDNPLPVKLKKAFSERFAAFLLLHGQVTISVKPGEFWGEGENILAEQPAEGEVLANLMHSCGIREITFSALTTAGEILSMLAAFTPARPEKAPSDEDLPGRLWEKRLPHIKFSIIAPPIMQGVNPGQFEIKDQTGSIEYREILPHQPGPDSLTEEQKKDERQSSQPQVQIVLEHLGPPQEWGKTEQREIQQRLAMEELTDPFSGELFILQEILLLCESEEAAFNDAITLLEKLFDEQLNNANLAACCRILAMAREVAEQLPRHRQQLLAMTDLAGDPARISLLFKAANATPQTSAMVFYNYLLYLDLSAFAVVVTRLAELEGPDLCRAFCRALEKKGKAALKLIGKALNDKRWFVVSQLISILGKIDDGRALDYLKKLLADPDSKVKKETLAALANIATPAASLLIAKVLPDDDLTVNIMALNYLARRPNKALLPVLRQGVEARNFAKKQDEEKKAWFTALAQAGRDEAVLILMKKINRFALFNRKILRAERIMAIEALGLCGKESVPFLKLLTGRRNRQIAQQAQEVLTGHRTTARPQATIGNRPG
ncbi:MAG: hypothetical protein A2505_07915 [Deltaproteobacteria bacterium RIFOXYD12_FULL_55_16]|nr:MAG: hypothetical protein A2505_07915 [Deltaproteobacteria bacterium RIFOXYD12_FULL_55_16]